MGAKKILQQAMYWLRAHWVRTLFIVPMAFLAVFTLAAYAGLNQPIDWSTIGLTETHFDLGGLSSLFATIAVLLCLGVEKEIKDKVYDEYDGNLWRPIILCLVLGGLMGVWLAVREFGFFVVNYLRATASPPSNGSALVYFSFAPGNIFLILSYALTANLCFTIMRAFSRIAKPPIENHGNVPQKGPHEPRDKEKGEVLRELVDIAMQAILIGLVAFIPRYSDSSLLNNIGGSGINGVIGFMIILACMLASLLLLAFLKSSLAQKKIENDSTGTYCF